MSSFHPEVKINLKFYMNQLAKIRRYIRSLSEARRHYINLPTHISHGHVTASWRGLNIYWRITDAWMLLLTTGTPRLASTQFSFQGDRWQDNYKGSIAAARVSRSNSRVDCNKGWSWWDT